MYFLQILQVWILRSRGNADSHMTKLKVTGKTKHLFRSYSVCFYRAMLPQIIDSGRFVNAYRTVHVWVCSHGHLLRTLPAARDLATFTGVSSSDTTAFDLPRGRHKQGAWASSLPRPLATASVWVLASLCSSFLVYSCYVVASLFYPSYLRGEDSLCLSRIIKTYTFIYKCINI